VYIHIYLIWTVLLDKIPLDHILWQMIAYVTQRII